MPGARDAMKTRGVSRRARASKARGKGDGALAQLRKAEELFRGFFDDAPIGKSMTAPGGRLVRVNRAFCEMLGYSAKELQGFSFETITHPDDLAESRECVRALLAGERDTWEMEKRYVAKDGHHVWARVTTGLQRAPDGKPLHLLTHVLDISDRKRAEQAARLGAVYARGSDAILDGFYRRSTQPVHTHIAFGLRTNGLPPCRPYVPGVVLDIDVLPPFILDKILLPARDSIELGVRTPTVAASGLRNCKPVITVADDIDPRTRRTRGRDEKFPASGGEMAVFVRESAFRHR